VLRRITAFGSFCRKRQKLRFSAGCSSSKLLTPIVGATAIEFFTKILIA